MKSNEPFRLHIRRDKTGPAEDFWHTMRVGVVVALVILVATPLLSGS